MDLGPLFRDKISGSTGTIRNITLRTHGDIAYDRMHMVGNSSQLIDAAQIMLDGALAYGAQNKKLLQASVKSSKQLTRYSNVKAVINHLSEQEKLDTQAVLHEIEFQTRMASLLQIKLQTEERFQQSRDSKLQLDSGEKYDDGDDIGALNSLAESVQTLLSQYASVGGVANTVNTNAKYEAGNVDCSTTSSIESGAPPTSSQAIFASSHQRGLHHILAAAKVLARLRMEACMAEKQRRYSLEENESLRMRLEEEMAKFEAKAAAMEAVSTLKLEEVTATETTTVTGCSYARSYPSDGMAASSPARSQPASQAS
jgi:hypothetical protein